MLSILQYYNSTLKLICSNFRQRFRLNDPKSLTHLLKMINIEKNVFFLWNQKLEVIFFCMKNIERAFIRFHLPATHKHDQRSVNLLVYFFLTALYQQNVHKLVVFMYCLWLFICFYEKMQPILIITRTHPTILIIIYNFAQSGIFIWYMCIFSFI